MWEETETSGTKQQASKPDTAMEKNFLAGVRAQTAATFGTRPTQFAETLDGQTVAPKKSQKPATTPAPVSMIIDVPLESPKSVPVAQQVPKRKFDDVEVNDGDDDDDDDDDDDKDDDDEEDDDDDDNEDDDAEDDEDADVKDKWLPPAQRIREMKRNARPKEGALVDPEGGKSDDEDAEMKTPAEHLFGEKGVKEIHDHLKHDPAFKNGMPNSAIAFMNTYVTNMLATKDPMALARQHGFIGDSKQEQAEAIKRKNQYENLRENLLGSMTTIEGQFRPLDLAVSKYTLVRACVSAVLPNGDTLVAIALDPFRESALIAFGEDKKMWGKDHKMPPITERRYALFSKKPSTATPTASTAPPPVAATPPAHAAKQKPQPATADSAITARVPWVTGVTDRISGEHFLRAGAERRFECYNARERAEAAGLSIVPNALFATLRQRRRGRLLCTTITPPAAQKMQNQPNSFVYHVHQALVAKSEETDITIGDYVMEPGKLFPPGALGEYTFVFAHGLFGMFPMQTNIDAADIGASTVCVITSHQIEDIDIGNGAPMLTNLILKKNELPNINGLYTANANIMKLMRALWVAYIKEIGFVAGGTTAQYVAARAAVVERRPTVRQWLEGITQQKFNATNKDPEIAVQDMLDKMFDVLISSA